MNNFSFEQLVKVIETAKASGVKELEMPGLKLNFRYPVASKQQSVLIGRTNDVAQTGNLQVNNHAVSAWPTEPELTQEELLFYATPRFDEIQAEKKAHKEKLAGETHGI